MEAAGSGGGGAKPSSLHAIADLVHQTFRREGYITETRPLKVRLLCWALVWVLFGGTSLTCALVFLLAARHPPQHHAPQEAAEAARIFVHRRAAVRGGEAPGCGTSGTREGRRRGGEPSLRSRE